MSAAVATPANVRFRLIKDKCTYDPTARRGVVCIESVEREPSQFSNAITELQTPEARTFALQEVAYLGMNFVNGNVQHPYPVNHKGQALDEVDQNLPVDHPDKQPAAYRLEVPVAASMR